MSWIAALDILFKNKKYYDQYKKVKKVHDYGKKIEKADPKKLTWDDLKYFNNKTMDAATKSAREAVKQAKDAENAVLVWPKSDSIKAFGAALKATKKHGANSAQTKKAVQVYIGVLKRFDADLVLILNKMTAGESELKKRLQLAMALREYAGLLQKAFMKAAKVPSLTGTAQNAMFFSLSQDAIQFRGLAGTLATSFQKIEKKNIQYIKECKAKINENKAWITWASGVAPQQDGALQKNKTAKKPKK